MHWGTARKSMVLWRVRLRLDQHQRNGAVARRNVDDLARGNHKSGVNRIAARRDGNGSAFSDVVSSGELLIQHAPAGTAERIRGSEGQVSGLGDRRPTVERLYNQRGFDGVEQFVASSNGGDYGHSQGTRTSMLTAVQAYLYPGQHRTGAGELGICLRQSRTGNHLPQSRLRLGTVCVPMLDSGV
jgi:hypothetical protein